MTVMISDEQQSMVLRHDRLHELLRLALDASDDLDRTLYRPDRSVWHWPGGGVVHVGLAGMVLAGRLGVPVNHDVDPRHAGAGGRATEHLWAIDLLGEGETGLAWSHLHHCRDGAPTHIGMIRGQRHGRGDGTFGAPMADRLEAVRDWDDWSGWDRARPVYEELHEHLVRCEDNPAAIVNYPVHFCVEEDGRDWVLGALTVDEAIAEVKRLAVWENGAVDIRRLADRTVVAASVSVTTWREEEEEYMGTFGDLEGLDDDFMDDPCRGGTPYGWS